MRWIEIARTFVGTREVKGPGNNPTIVAWLVRLGAWWRDDETPWCGVFAGACLKQAGLEPPQAYYRARAWETWGSALTEPAMGCVVVFSRQGGGHVGFVVGVDSRGRLQLLGGNQGDAVSVATFERSRVTAYRWPLGVPLSGRPPVITAAALSTSEA